MFNAINTSTSALIAQRVRLNTIAMNMANADTVQTAEGGPYKRRSVVFEEGRQAGSDGGDGVHVSEINQENIYRWDYDPKNPYANEDGYVKMPGIDTFTEMVNAMEATRAYEANLTAIELSKGMLNNALRILA